MNEILSPSEPPRGFYGCSSGDKKRILRPAKPMKSAGLFSLDCLKGWEASLFSFKQAVANMEESASESMKKKLARFSFPLATTDTETKYLLTLIGDAHFKMLITSEFLGGNKNSGMVPLKLDDLLGSPELIEHFKGNGKSKQMTSSPPSRDNDNGEMDVETLKSIVGTIVLSLYGAENEPQ